MLTRSGVAKRLGKSIATVRRMEGAELHPIRDARGVLRFSVGEVERVACAEQHRSRGTDRVGYSAVELRATRDRLMRQDAELTELRHQVVALTDELNHERRRSARIQEEESERTRRLVSAAEERERAVRAKLDEQEHSAKARDAAARVALQTQVANLLESLSPRQLARIKPADLDEFLEFLRLDG